MPFWVRELTNLSPMKQAAEAMRSISSRGKKETTKKKKKKQRNILIKNS
jgi:hypothetical protein